MPRPLQPTSKKKYRRSTPPQLDLAKIHHQQDGLHHQAQEEDGVKISLSLRRDGEHQNRHRRNHQVLGVVKVQDQDQDFPAGARIQPHHRNPACGAQEEVSEHHHLQVKLKAYLHTQMAQEQDCSAIDLALLLLRKEECSVAVDQTLLLRSLRLV